MIFYFKMAFINNNNFSQGLGRSTELINYFTKIKVNVKLFAVTFIQTVSKAIKNENHGKPDINRGVTGSVHMYIQNKN